MIILFGVVGSGKSEQAKRLMARMRCPHISTSRLLRDSQNPHWQKLMMAGKLVPDSDILSVLEPQIDKLSAEHKEFILDGAPRSVGQAEWLVKKIKDGELKLTAIIYLKVSKETTLRRLLKRGRDDDTEEVISERFKQYDDVTTPVLNYFKSQGFKVSDMDGELESDIVEERIWTVLKDKVSASQDR